MNSPVITQHLGLTAPGIVFENIIKALSQQFSVTVITYHNNLHSQEFASRSLDIIELEEPISLNVKWTYHLNRLWYKFFNISWTNKVAKTCFSLKNRRYDLAYALCSMHNTIPLSVAKKINLSYHILVAAYFVDAIPTPLWWSTSRSTNGIKKLKEIYQGFMLFRFSEYCR